jgi:hypothetical protein
MEAVVDAFEAYLRHRSTDLLPVSWTVLSWKIPV